MSTPDTYLIKEKPPEPPCWIFGLLWKDSITPTWRLSDYGDVTDLDTHWSPFTQDRPTHDPRTPQPPALANHVQPEGQPIAVLATPRTYKAEYNTVVPVQTQDGPVYSFVRSDFARTLERETVSLQARLEAAEKIRIDWTPVTAALPPDGADILAFGPRLGYRIGGPTIEECQWKHGALWNEGGTECDNLKFTHWMLMPVAPSPP